MSSHGPEPMPEDLAPSVRQAFDAASRFQLEGQLEAAAAEFERGVLAHKNAGGSPSEKIAAIQSNVAGLWSDLGHPDKALATARAAEESWQVCDGEGRIFWLGMCAHAAAVALCSLGRLPEGLRESNMAWGWFHRFAISGNPEAQNRPPDLTPGGVSDLIVRVGMIEDDEADATSFFAITLARHGRVTALISAKLGNFGEALAWLDAVYRSIPQLRGRLRVPIAAEVGQGYESLIAVAPDDPQVAVAIQRAEKLAASISGTSFLDATLDVDALEIESEELSRDEFQSASSEVRQLLAESRRLAERGEISEGISGLMEAIDKHQNETGGAFDTGIADARASLCVLLADAGLAEPALQVANDASNELNRYPEAERPFHLALISLGESKAFSQLGRKRDAIASAQSALKSLLAWSRGCTDLGDPKDQPDMFPEAAAELLDVVTHMITEDSPASMVCLLIAQAMTCIGMAHIGELSEWLHGTVWMDLIFDRLAAFPGSEKALIEQQLATGYWRALMSLMAASEISSLEFHPRLEEVAARVESRAESLSEKFGPTVDQLTKQGGFDFRLQIALQQADSFSDRTQGYRSLDALAADPGLMPWPRKRAAALMYMAALDLRNGRQWDSTYKDPGDAEPKLKTALSLLGEDGAGDLLYANCEFYLSVVCFRKNALEESLSRACKALKIALQFVAETEALERFLCAPHNLTLLGQIWRVLGIRSAGVFWAKLGLSYGRQGLQRTMGPLQQSARLIDQISHDRFGTELEDWLIEDGRIGEALMISALKEREGEQDLANQSFPRDSGNVFDRIRLSPLERRHIDKLAEISEAAVRGGGSQQEFDDLIANLAYQFVAADVALLEENAAFEKHELEAASAGIPWDHDTAIVRVDFLGDRLRIIVSNQDGAEAQYQSISEKELSQTVFYFLNSLTAPRESFNFSNSETLYDYLIAPIVGFLERFGVHRLVLNLKGPLRFIPVAALHDGDRYLVERYSCVTLVPSHPELHNVSPKPAPAVHLLGRVAGGSDLGIEALPAVDQEFETIAAVCEAAGRAFPTEPAMDESFTANALIHALTSPGVTHVASHFFNDPADARASRLLLGDGNLFGIDQIAALGYGPDRPDLVTLSACSTGVPSTFAEASAAVSPGLALHSIGIPAALVTLWPVVSSSTAEVMYHFYRNLFGSRLMDKAEALRQAQLALLYQTPSSSDTDYRHPHYWAPFCLSGNWLPFYDSNSQAPMPTYG